MRRVQRISLLVKITVALAAALTMVIGLYTYFLIRLESRWNEDRHTAIQSLVTMTVREQFVRSLLGKNISSNHPPRVLYSEPGWPKIWVLNHDEKIIASNSPSEINQSWKNRPSRQDILTIPMSNMVECRGCHDTEISKLAQIRIDTKGIAPIRIFRSQISLILGYGFIMGILILSGMIFCLIYFVRDPIASLLQLMQQAQSGNLGVRFRLRGRDEITKLGHGFNLMIHSLAKARVSLQSAHESQIQQAEKLASVGELASGLAHEIRNPLAGIKTAVQVLSEKINTMSGNDDLKEVAQEVAVQTERVNRLVNDMLQYVRPKSPQNVDCSLRDLVEKCVKFVLPQATKQKIDVIWTPPAEDFEIHADPSQIQQAILNLILNAIQAMQHHGRLELKLWRRDDFVLLEIKDNGPGIPAAVQQRVFSPFFTTKPQGTGLGLSITRGIIQRHRGRLQFESAPGQGTTFTLELPIHRS